MRLTEKFGNDHYRLLPKFCEKSFIASDKLGQLEDVEELCDKISRHIIFVKNLLGKIVKANFTDYSILYDFQQKRIEIYGLTFVYMLELSEYGKTWALTKEELL